MKKTLICGLLVAGGMAFTACSQDYVYEKEYDTKAYYNGSDPRDNLVYFAKTEIDIPVKYVGDLPASQDTQEQNIVVNLSRTASKGSIAIAMNAEAPELKTTYADYAVGTTANIDLPAADVAVPEGSHEINVSTMLKGLTGLTGNTVLPLSVAAKSGELATASAEYSTCYLRLRQKQVLTIGATDISRSIAILPSGNKLSGDESITVRVSVSESVDKGIAVGLVRNDKLFDQRPESMKAYQLAPDGVYTEGVKADLGEASSPFIGGTLTNLQAFTATGTYVIPLQVVVYDKAGKAYPMTGEQGMLYAVIECSNDKFGMVDAQPAGTILPTTGWTITSSDGDNDGITNLLDDNASTWWYASARSIDLTIDMLAEKNVTGMMFEVNSSYQFYAPKTVTVYINKEDGSWERASGTLKWSNGSTQLCLEALTEVKTSKLVIHMEGSYIIFLSDIKVFGK